MPFDRRVARCVVRTLAAAVAVGSCALACSQTDPLDAIRQRQAGGDFAGTVEPLRSLLDERRDDPEVLYRYGHALVMTGQTSMAEWSLRQAMQDPEWRLAAGMQLAYAALGTSNYTQAITTLDELLAEHPDNTEALLLRASAHAHSRLDPEAALADAARVLEADPESLEAMEPRILALLLLEREEEAGEAIAELGRRIAEDGAEPVLAGWHCATAALFAEDTSNTELAEQRWERCLEEHPAHPNVVTKGIEFYDGRGEYARSLEILEKAYEAEPRSRAFRVLLGVRLRAAGRTTEAEKVLREATLTGPVAARAAAFLDLVKHYQEIGRFDDAAEAADRAVELARSVGQADPSLVLEQADSRLMAGDLDVALRIAEQMTVPGHRAMVRARVAQERGELAQALVLFDEAFRLWPDNPWARHYAAEAAEAIGDFDRALEEYRHAVRIAPGETNARTLAARILVAEGKPVHALAILAVKTPQFPLDPEGERLKIRAQAAAGQSSAVAARLEQARKQGGPIAELVESALRGAHDYGGPSVALRALRDWEARGFVDFRHPAFANALRTLVELAIASGDDAARQFADARLQSALAARPAVAAFHEIHGRMLEAGGADPEAAESAYARALEREPGNARAMLGMAASIAARDPQRARELVDEAVRIGGENRAVLRDAARLQASAGRRAEAMQALEAALALDPTDARAAVQLAELAREQPERSLPLARRAERFGRDAGTFDQLVRFHTLRGDSESAKAAKERAVELRRIAIRQ